MWIRPTAPVPPTPYTLLPTPYTPYTLHPTPYTSRLPAPVPPLNPPLSGRIHFIIVMASWPHSLKVMEVPPVPGVPGVPGAGGVPFRRSTVNSPASVDPSDRKFNGQPPERERVCVCMCVSERET